LPVYTIKYEAFLCSLQCGGCGRRVPACDGLWQPPSDACWTFGSYCWVLPLPSPAPWRSVRTTPPPHTSEELRSGPAGARGSTGYRSWKLVLSSYVLLTTLPRRAKLGGVPRGMRPAGTPPADPRRCRPAGGPVAGADLGIEPLDAKRLGITLWFLITRND
jgi:hypothetical protein